MEVGQPWTGARETSVAAARCMLACDKLPYWECDPLKAEGKSVIHMEFGQPSTGAPKAAIAKAHTMLDTDKLPYWESHPLKARIARHYLDTYGVTVRPSQITMTCGASAALVAALAAAFQAGDVIAMA